MVANKLNYLQYTSQSRKIVKFSKVHIFKTLKQFLNESEKVLKL